MAVTRTQTRIGKYIIDKFTGSGSLSVNLPFVDILEYLIVAGGGGGGYGIYLGAGGGGGGVLAGTLTLSPRGTILITVGAGGAGGSSSNSGVGTAGGNSSIGSTLIAYGGGRGGHYDGFLASSGGCGGGGAFPASTGTGAAGTTGQGYKGGDFLSNAHTCGAGGGGAGAVGGNTSTSKGGDGGTGKASSITGIETYYGGGGGGCGYGVVTPGAGGNGGGGAGSTGAATNGTSGLGGGGGGAERGGTAKGGDGGSGVVIIKYVDPTYRFYSMFPPVFGTGGSGTEYSWDAVNVDHGMTPGDNAVIVEMTDNISHNIIAAMGSEEVELGAVNVMHAIYPTATLDRIVSPYDDNPTLISVDVSKGMDDPMMQATFNYDTDYVGNIFGNDYMTRIVVKIPDLNAVERTVFIGIAPSSHAKYSPAADKMTLTAVDYALYLTKQTLEDMDLALLPPADQAAEGSNTAKVLTCDFIVKPFQLGMHVVGQISAATGTIIEIAQTSSGVRITMYPASGKFVDDELLRVGGVDYAQADGRSVDIPYTPYYSTIYPEDWVTRVLGGNTWMRVTGIEPYRLANSAGYWDTDDCPAVPFMFGSLEKKYDAIKRLAKYMRYIFVVKPRDTGGGNYVPAAYFVKESDIDDPSNGLDLPAPVSITGPNDVSLAAPLELDQNGENQVDLVRVMCQDLKGNWLEAKRSNSRVDSGEGPYREFRDEPQDIATQIDLEAYVDDMFALYSSRGSTWNAVLVERSDLQLYQLLTISGFGSKIPDGTYRIIKIRHVRSCAINLTYVSFMSATAFSTLLRYGLTYTDSITEVKRIMKHQDDQKPQLELAKVISNDGWNLTYATEAGNKGKGRDGTSTPATAGVIPIGAKVMVQNTRGGTVCIPVVAASGGSIDLLTVDVPTIVSAARDDSDHNYWFLQWTPGANNTNVSVNVQISSYPASPGVVTGPGKVYQLYLRSTTRIRIRFSGPSTTYYIKLWGEKNGVYSATGAQATITSGADVTVGDDEDPEQITVIDQKLTEEISGNSAGAQSFELFNGPLPFNYNGIDNIYIGGPANAEDTDVSIWPPLGTMPTPRYMCIDNILRITANGHYIDVGSYSVAGWYPPVNIKNLLVPGANTVKLELLDIGAGHGFVYLISPLWVRTYYL